MILDYLMYYIVCSLILSLEALYLSSSRRITQSSRGRVVVCFMSTLYLSLNLSVGSSLVLHT
jgi:hypothetical protein